MYSTFIALCAHVSAEASVAHHSRDAGYGEFYFILYDLLAEEIIILNDSYKCDQHREHREHREHSAPLPH